MALVFESPLGQGLLMAGQALSQGLEKRYQNQAKQRKQSQIAQLLAIPQDQQVQQQGAAPGGMANFGGATGIPLQGGIVNPNQPYDFSQLNQKAFGGNQQGQPQQGQPQQGQPQGQQQSQRQQPQPNTYLQRLMQNPEQEGFVLTSNLIAAGMDPNQAAAQGNARTAQGNALKKQQQQQSEAQSLQNHLVAKGVPGAETTSDLNTLKLMNKEFEAEQKPIKEQNVKYAQDTMIAFNDAKHQIKNVERMRELSPWFNGLPGTLANAFMTTPSWAEYKNLNILGLEGYINVLTQGRGVVSGEKIKLIKEGLMVSPLDSRWVIAAKENSMEKVQEGAIESGKHMQKLLDKYGNAARIPQNEIYNLQNYQDAILENATKDVQLIASGGASAPKKSPEDQAKDDALASETERLTRSNEFQKIYEGLPTGGIFTPELNYFLADMGLKAKDALNIQASIQRGGAKSIGSTVDLVNEVFKFIGGNYVPDLVASVTTAATGQPMTVKEIAEKSMDFLSGGHSVPNSIVARYAENISERATDFLPLGLTKNVVKGIFTGSSKGLSGASAAELKSLRFMVSMGAIGGAAEQTVKEAGGDQYQQLGALFLPFLTWGSYKTFVAGLSIAKNPNLLSDIGKGVANQFNRGVAKVSQFGKGGPPPPGGSGGLPPPPPPPPPPYRSNISSPPSPPNMRVSSNKTPPPPPDSVIKSDAELLKSADETIAKASQENKAVFGETQKESQALTMAEKESTGLSQKTSGKSELTKDEMNAVERNVLTTEYTKTPASGLPKEFSDSKLAEWQNIVFDVSGEKGVHDAYQLVNDAVKRVDKKKAFFEAIRHEQDLAGVAQRNLYSEAAKEIAGVKATAKEIDKLASSVEKLRSVKKGAPQSEIEKTRNSLIDRDLAKLRSKSELSAEKEFERSQIEANLKAHEISGKYGKVKLQGVPDKETLQKQLAALNTGQDVALIQGLYADAGEVVNWMGKNTPEGAMALKLREVYKDFLLNKYGARNPAYKKKFLDANKLYANNARGIRSEAMLKYVKGETPHKILAMLDTPDGIAKFRKVMAASEDLKKIGDSIIAMKVNSIVKNELFDAAGNLKTGMASVKFTPVEEELLVSLLGQENWNRFRKLQSDLQNAQPKIESYIERVVKTKESSLTKDGKRMALGDAFEEEAVKQGSISSASGQSSAQELKLGERATQSTGSQIKITPNEVSVKGDNIWSDILMGGLIYGGHPILGVTAKVLSKTNMVPRVVNAIMQSKGVQKAMSDLAKEAKAGSNSAAPLNKLGAEVAKATDQL